MIVERKLGDTLKKFGSLSPGDVFKVGIVGKARYMKTHSIGVQGVRSVDLETGQVYSYSDEVEVVRLPGKFIEE